MPWTTWQIYVLNATENQSLGSDQMTPIILFVWTVTFSKYTT
jgi:hypothetical protein